MRRAAGRTVGRLQESRYAVLDERYANEQEQLIREIETLEATIAAYENRQQSSERFIALLDKYERFDPLTTTMLNEFVEKILVHERARKGSVETTQEVEIYFKFIGKNVPPHFGEMKLTPEEAEALRKREERKDKLHQAYLRRKASGAQKKYEDKVRAKKKAERVIRRETIFIIRFLWLNNATIYIQVGLNAKRCICFAQAIANAFYLYGLILLDGMWVWHL